MILQPQPTVVKIPDDFNMKHFNKFVGLYNALIRTERAQSIRITYYNNQGAINMEQLCDYTEEERETVLKCWEDYSDFFKDVQTIFEVIRDSNFTQPFNKNMMKVLNNIYKTLITEYGWTIIHEDIYQKDVDNTHKIRGYYVPVNRKPKNINGLAFQTYGMKIIQPQLHHIIHTVD